MILQSVTVVCEAHVMLVQGSPSPIEYRWAVLNTAGTWPEILRRYVLSRSIATMPHRLVNARVSSTASILASQTAHVLTPDQHLCLLRCVSWPLSNCTILSLHILCHTMCVHIVRMCCSLLACITCSIFTQEIGSGGSRSLANVFAGGGDTRSVRAKRADAVTHRLVFLYSLRSSLCNSAHQECNRAKVKGHAS